MGTEMIAKATNNFDRKQRECLERLEAPDLFTLSPRVAIALVASPDDRHTFKVGEQYRLVLQESCVIVVRGVSPVGSVPAVPRSFVEMMRGPAPSAQACVRGVSEFTGEAELEVRTTDGHQES